VGYIFALLLPRRSFSSWGDKKILDDRGARGEIRAEEYTQMKKE